MAKNRPAKEPKVPQEANQVKETQVGKKPKKTKEPKITGAEKEQHGLFKKKRGGATLTKDQVKEIKVGRKKLRKDMRKMGIKSRKEFELTASSLGLYYDKNRFWALFWWFLRGKGFWILAAAAFLLLLALFGLSFITQMRGHFTISMSDKLFREGFTLSETEDFENPTSHLFCTPIENVPCISIADLPKNVQALHDDNDGRYFVYTYYIRNEGENTADYKWSIRLNSESKSLSKAAWVMVFEDDEMQFFAKEKENGKPEVLPAYGNEDWAYIEAPYYWMAKDPEDQYEIIRETSALTYWRIKPKPFRSDEVVTEGWQFAVKPMDVHKYTVVIWLEGDDPDCTNELIGGHLGLDVYMELIE